MGARAIQEASEDIGEGCKRAVAMGSLLVRSKTSPPTFYRSIPIAYPQQSMTRRFCVKAVACRQAEAAGLCAATHSNTTGGRWLPWVS